MFYHVIFAGDTAQSIMRGVAFRFDDLKSLFYYASKSVKSLGKHSKARVPKRVYQLTHNYRSHAGRFNGLSVWFVCQAISQKIEICYCHVLHLLWPIRKYTIQWIVLSLLTLLMFPIFNDFASHTYSLFLFSWPLPSHTKSLNVCEITMIFAMKVQICISFS